MALSEEDLAFLKKIGQIDQTPIKETKKAEEE
jgi:hypothetical protein